MSAEALNENVLETRLGDPQEVAAAVEEQAPRALFARRHPVIIYLLLPIPLLVALWVAYTLALAGILSGFQSYKDTVWAVNTAGILIHGIAYVPTVILTLLLAWLAIRSRTQIVWWLAGAALVAIVSGMLMVTFRVPTTPGTGLLQIGLGFPPALARWPQIAIPLAITLAFLAHAVFTRREPKCSSMNGAG
jgi:hypothetical protein